MQSCQFATGITAVACAIFQCVPEEDIPLLAAAFTQLGDTLATMSGFNERFCEKNEDNNQSNLSK